MLADEAPIIDECQHYITDGWQDVTGYTGNDYRKFPDCHHSDQCGNDVARATHPVSSRIRAIRALCLAKTSGSAKSLGKGGARLST